MSRLRVRTPSGSWLDICESEWYVRDSKNLNWIRLVVSREMKVRHGANSYWLNIECDLDDLYCPPEETIDCWPGRTGDFDSAKIIPGGVSGTLICDCDGKNCITYYGPGPDDQSFNASYTNTVNNGNYLGTASIPLPCPVTVFGGKANISEFYVDLGQVSGLVNLNFRGVTHPIRVRVYKDCELLADSESESSDVKTVGKVQSGFLRFMNDTITGSGRVLVRVDAPTTSAIWNVSLSCPNLDEIFDVLNPAPCYGTYDARIGCGKFSTIERHHKLDGTGAVHLDLWPGDIPVRVTVFYQGRILATTGSGDVGFIAEATSLSWYFTPANGDDIVLIRVDANEATVNWTYSIYCPGQNGSFKNPDNTCGNGNYPVTCEQLRTLCDPSSARNSNGAAITDTWYNLKGQPDGKIRIDYVFDGNAQIIVYDVNGNVLGGTAPTSGSGRTAIMLVKSKHGDKIRVRVIGECGPAWAFTVADPLPLPKVSIADTSVVRGPYGTTKSMCYAVQLSHLYDEIVKVTYNTQSALAEATEDCVQRVSEVSPFVSSTDSVLQISDTYPVPDYKPVIDGVLSFNPCERKKDICIEVCGTDRAGPNRLINVNLTNPVNAIIADGVGVGTIINPNTVNCDQATQIAVKDGGSCEIVKNGARKMFTQTSIGAANYLYTSVMDMELNIPVAGTYTFVLHGDDEAELYLDCEHVVTAKTSPNFFAVGTRYWVPEGKHYLYIVYKNTFGPARNTSYASMAILKNDGSVFYSSNAAHWRGRVISEGVAPKCNQFAEACSVNPTGGVINSPSYNDSNIGYAATRIQSALHPVDCAPANAFYVLERKMTFPETGTYSIAIMADDNYWFNIDCVLVASGALHAGGNMHSFHVAAGERLVTVMYKNIPNCTPGWVKFAIIAPSGGVFYLSEATGWKSLAGNLDALGQPLVTTSSGYNSLASYGAQALKAPWQPHYAWFTAERTFNFPKDDTYTIMCMADDQMELFAACTSVGVGEHYTYVTTRRAFIPAGETNIIVRCFNAKAKHANWFSFAILDSAGNVVLVSNNAGAWKCRPGDVDRSNM